MRAVCRTRTARPTCCGPAVIWRPTIGGGEVLVRVHAAGVDQGAWHLMAGLPYPIRLAGFGFRAPKARVRGLATWPASSRRSAAA